MTSTPHKEKQGEKSVRPARVFILIRRACRTLYQRGGKSRIEIRTAILGGMEAYEPLSMACVETRRVVCHGNVENMMLI